MTEDIERIYTIPLRSSWLKEPRVSRANRSIRTIRVFLEKHTKAKDMKISKGINEMIFAHGFKKPPGKITVEVKGNRDLIQVKLPGEKIELKKAAPAKGIAGLRERLAGKAAEGKPKEEKAEEKKEAPETEKKEEPKKEVKTEEKKPEKKKAKEPEKKK